MTLTKKEIYLQNNLKPHIAMQIKQTNENFLFAAHKCSVSNPKIKLFNQENDIFSFSSLKKTIQALAAL